MSQEQGDVGMQAKRKHHIKPFRMGRAACAGAAGQRKRRLAVLLCGLLFCCAAAAAAVRACAQQAAPAGCSLQSRVPDGDFIFPLGTSGWRVSSGYGWRDDPMDGEAAFHKGIDLACAEGTPVLAAFDGIVFAAEWSASYGNYIRLGHSGGAETVYAHLQYLYVRPGELVRAGQVIGTAGQTGRATGSHLHFELACRAVRYDPSELLGVEGTG